MITIKSDEEIEIMREAGRIAAEVLQRLVEAVKPGVVEKELDKIVRKAYAKRGAVPTFLGYQGYPATVCVSINEELVHGIPGDRVILEGDIVSIDLGATHKGYVGDAAVTLGVRALMVTQNKTLTERDLEVAVLDRGKERRKFRRIPPEVLHQLLTDGK